MARAAAMRAEGRSVRQIATVYGIVKQSGGCIDVCSEPGSGTSFTILLPRHVGEAHQTPTKVMRLARGEIHPLLTDVVMPEMNGRDLAKSILSLHPALKVLFMSGYPADVMAHQGVLDEGVNFLAKPISREELATAVRQALDRP